MLAARLLRSTSSRRISARVTRDNLSRSSISWAMSLLDCCMRPRKSCPWLSSLL